MIEHPDEPVESDEVQFEKRVDGLARDIRALGEPITESGFQKKMEHLAGNIGKLASGQKDATDKPRGNSR